ncbi:hypothetical protein NE261_05410 [Enterococcus italicus]|uniref:hypothetical protein n=1 Tax=Enterococcus italicus TaxID=246144 RepID=UPI00207465D5|nr:hypothetical protein [Enterococcus italicus]MCM6931247.1 hypothetical protein [Enterococcus italicus]
MIATIITSMLVSLFVSVIYSTLYIKRLVKFTDEIIKKKEYFVRREIEKDYQKELLKSRWK